MAALALAPTRSLFSSFSRMAGVGLLLPLAPRAWTVAVPSLLDVLSDLFPSILRAVPKKKVSHSRKAMRSANKGLQDKHNIVHCPACGSPKLAHNLCPTCFSEINRRWKREAKSTEPEASTGTTQ